MYERKSKVTSRQRVRQRDRLGRGQKRLRETLASPAATSTPPGVYPHCDTVSVLAWKHRPTSAPLQRFAWNSDHVNRRSTGRNEADFAGETCLLTICSFSGFDSFVPNCFKNLRNVSHPFSLTQCSWFTRSKKSSSDGWARRGSQSGSS